LGLLLVDYIADYEIEGEDCEDVHEWVDEEPWREKTFTLHYAPFFGPVYHAASGDDQEAELG